MAYDALLVDRIRLNLNRSKILFSEKEMMGGPAFMVNDKMCVGITNSDLTAPIYPDIYEEALTRKGVREMDFTKKPMKGWIYVSPEGIDTDEELVSWIQLALDFNPKTKSRKKRK